MPVVMIFQTALSWALLAFFSSLAAASDAHEANAAQPSQESATATSPTPKPTPTADEEEEQEIRRNHQFLGEPAKASAPAQTSMFIGREVPVATQYTAPCITPQANGGYVVQPATPTALETRRTGMTINGEGFEETEIEGFIDYGSPIRTVVPVYNEKGEVIGTAVQEHRNPILQPVFKTIRNE
jgi:hypothetical protein